MSSTLLITFQEFCLILKTPPPGARDHPDSHLTVSKSEAPAGRAPPAQGHDCVTPQDLTPASTLQAGAGSVHSGTKLLCHDATAGYCVKAKGQGGGTRRTVAVRSGKEAARGVGHHETLPGYRYSAFCGGSRGCGAVVRRAFPRNRKWPLLWARPIKAWLAPSQVTL